MELVTIHSDPPPDFFEVPNQCCHLMTCSQPQNKNTVSFASNWELISPPGSLDPPKVLSIGCGFLLLVSSIGPRRKPEAWTRWHDLPPPCMQPGQSAHHREGIVITMVCVGSVAGAQ